MQYFLEPLLEIAKLDRGIITASEVQALFSNIRVIHDLSVRMLSTLSMEFRSIKSAEIPLGKYFIDWVRQLLHRN
jgi:hypothetical protein